MAHVSYDVLVFWLHRNKEDRFFISQRLTLRGSDRDKTYPLQGRTCTTRKLQRFRSTKSSRSPDQARDRALQQDDEIVFSLLRYGHADGQRHGAGGAVDTPGRSHYSAGVGLDLLALEEVEGKREEMNREIH